MQIRSSLLLSIGAIVGLLCVVIAVLLSKPQDIPILDPAQKKMPSGSPNSAVVFRPSHRYIKDAKRLATERGKFPLPNEGPDLPSGPIWSSEVSNYSNMLLFPAGTADERYCVNVQLGGPKASLSFTTFKMGVLKKEWHIRLLQHGPDWKQNNAEGALEIFLARSGLQAVQPYAKDVAARLRETHPLAGYITLPRAPGTDSIFIDASGQLQTEHLSASPDPRKFGKLAFHPPVTSFERAWLASLTNVLSSGG